MSTSPVINHLCISAAAGSGKTWQLTTRFLHLILQNAPPSNILATTFTRLAAAQIRDRIISRLIEALEHPEKHAELEQATGMALSDTIVRKTLAHFVTNLSNLNIRTLDSFFGGIAQTQTIELGLPPNLQTIDDARTTLLRREAIRRVLARTDSQHMIELLSAITLGAVDVPVINAVESAVVKLHDACRDATADAWHQFPTINMPDKTDVESSVNTLLNFKYSDRRFQKACIKVVGQHQRNEWEKLLGEKIVNDVTLGEGCYGGKEIDEPVADALQILAHHAHAFGTHVINSRTRAIQQLVNGYAKAFDHVKLENEVATYADITQAVSNVINSDVMESIWYRMDARIHHLLLDEFQDTSVDQWNAIKPLTIELLSNRPPERSVLCVGDVKQSIYGWRGGVPELLPRMPYLTSTDQPCMDTLDLQTSYRSAPAIIEFVNMVFTDIDHCPGWDGQTHTPEQWKKSFHTHETVKKDLQGYVRVHTLDENQDAIDETVNTIRELHNDAPDASIGVLARKNDTCRKLVERLLEFDLPAADFGGGPLTDAAPVNAMLDLLQLAAHPNDTAAAFHVIHSPLQRALQLDETLHHPKNIRARVQLAREFRSKLLDRGFGPVLADWTFDVRENCTPAQRRRLVQMIELAEQLDANDEHDIDAAITVLETTRVNQLADAPIKVMTINGAKGLEFDFVVLTDTETTLCTPRKPDDGAWILRDDPLGPVTTICRAVKKDLRPHFQDSQKMYDRHMQHWQRDQLCLFYVALTRAKRGMEIITPFPKTTKGGELYSYLRQSMAGMIWNALGNDIPDPGIVIDATGQRDEAIAERNAQAINANTPTPIAPPPTITVGGERALSGRSSASPSQVHRTSAATRSARQDTNDEPRLRGTAIHRLFEEITWLDEFATDGCAQNSRKHLAACSALAVPARDAAWHNGIVTDWLAMLEHDDIKTTLSRPAPDAIARLELPFVRRSKSGLQRGIIDRLVLTPAPDNRGYTHAHIIDWKTDDLGDSGLDGLIDRHRAQMDIYRTTVATLFDLEIANVDVTLVALGIGKTVAVPHRG